nr:hypothetical protein [Pseudoxanthomonas sp.]
MAIWLNNLPVVVQGLYLFQFRDAGNTPQVTIICDTTGTISAYRGTTTTLLGTSASAAIVAGAYQHVEAKVVFDNVAGSVEVRVNGVTVLSLTGVDTVATASVECSQICVMNTRSASTTNITGWFFDDVFAWDTSGTENNDFLGDRRVRTLFPDGNTASAGWTAVGAATGYECIDEAVPDEETTYIEAAGGTTPTSEFTLTDLPSVGAIAAVEVVTRSRKTNAGVANLQTSMVSGASVDVGADRPLTEVYTYRSDVSELDPATGVPWTQAAVNAAKLRIARTA